MNYKRVTARIDLDAIKYNIKQIREHVRPAAEIMGIIKADGYGHGAVPVAKTCQEAGINQFAVAMVKEGIALRKEGIHLPILILGYTDEADYEDLIQYNLTQTIYKKDMATALSACAKKYGKEVKVHIKIDTGMGRLGFLPGEDTVKTIQEIAHLPYLDIEGIYTHFSKADEYDKTYTRKQLDIYSGMLGALEKAGVHIPYSHAANSAGVIDVSPAHFDLVRTGIILYGLYPSNEVKKDQVKLKPALSLVSKIVHLKQVDKGQAISYGGDYITTRKTRVATIPVGYADGYIRKLANNGRVLIHGEFAPIIGRICMDYFMVDVTDIDLVKDQDEVVLIGRQKGKEISVEEIARRMESINYEVVCLLGKRVPRVYYKAGKVQFTMDYYQLLDQGVHPNINQ